MEIAYAIFFGLLFIGILMNLGLGEIARAIRYRNVDVNVKLPPVHLVSGSDAALEKE